MCVTRYPDFSLLLFVSQHTSTEQLLIRPSLICRYERIAVCCFVVGTHRANRLCQGYDEEEHCLRQEHAGCVLLSDTQALGIRQVDRQVSGAKIGQGDSCTPTSFTQMSMQMARLNSGMFQGETFKETVRVRG